MSNTSVLKHSRAQCHWFDGMKWICGLDSGNSSSAAARIDWEGNVMRLATAQKLLEVSCET
jgi:hypothetical protein